MKKAEGNGYVNEANKCIRDISKRNFILFVKLSNENRKDQGNT